MLWLIRLRYNFIDSVAIALMVIAFTNSQFLFAAVALIGGMALSAILTLIYPFRTKPMTYNDHDIQISITLGQRACAALNSKKELLIIQQKDAHNFSVINLGNFTEARAKELGEYLQRLAIHS